MDNKKELVKPMVYLAEIGDDGKGGGCVCGRTASADAEREAGVARECGQACVSDVVERESDELGEYLRESRRKREEEKDCGASLVDSCAAIVCRVGDESASEEAIDDDEAESGSELADATENATSSGARTGVDESDGDRKPLELDDDSRAEADATIERMLARRRKQAKKRLKDKKERKRIAKARKRQKPQHYPSFSAHPLTDDPFIDALYRRYGLGCYAGEGELSERSSLLWFETYPSGYKKDVKKAEKKRKGKKRAKADAARERHAGAECDEHYSSDLIDWSRVAKLDSKAETGMSFDPREIWNLDAVFPYLLYPRMMLFAREANGYDPAYATFEEYMDACVKPVIDGLELQIVHGMCNLSMEEDEFGPWTDRTKGEYRRLALTELRIYERIKEAYHVFAENFQSYWV